MIPLKYHPKIISSSALSMFCKNNINNNTNVCCMVWKRCNAIRTQTCPLWDYWDEDPFASLILDQHDDIGRLSFSSFNALIGETTKILKETIVGNLQDVFETSACILHNNEYRKIVLSIPIAVAIPEGLYLPLAIATVYALNTPFSLASYHVSAVLVLLEPSEGKSRLQHMIANVRPVLILTVSVPDYERLQEIVDELDDVDAPIIQSNVFLSKECRVVDWKEIVKKAVHRIDLDVNKLQLDGTTGADGKSSLDTPPDINYVSMNRISHIVFTSGTTGVPKGCMCSIRSMETYLKVKNKGHGISEQSTVLLASALSFDPCMSDILATLQAGATLALPRRAELREDLGRLLQLFQITHVLCTPTLWSTLTSTHVTPSDVPYLQVIALGGESIPPLLVRTWAPKDASQRPRLLATYGVTEACVYQTAGDIIANIGNDSQFCIGQAVGQPFAGTGIRICDDNKQDECVDMEATGYPQGVGEIVLYGEQLDGFSGYFGKPDLSIKKFLHDDETNCICYRTGDRGYFDSSRSCLYVLGRINSEASMVKFNGIRIELGEIETALVDDVCDFSVVTGAICSAIMEAGDSTISSTAHTIVAYVVLSQECLEELKISCAIPDSGAICDVPPLLALLQARCRLRSRVIPSSFVVIPRIPTSPTGKRSRHDVPPINMSVMLGSLSNGNTLSNSAPLCEYGYSGRVVSHIIQECLNLQSSQLPLLTASATFAMLGGDSLAATRLVRALYAYHNKVHNTRYIGGEYGMLDGPFAVARLLTSPHLGAYVDWLDQNQVCQPTNNPTVDMANGDYENDNNQPQTSVSRHDEIPDTMSSTMSSESLLYDSLLQATAQVYTSVARGLLSAGADPNYGAHNQRRGKIKQGRLARRNAFRTSPLHMACLMAQPTLVAHLLEKGAKYNTPDASELFPLHLAAGGKPSSSSLAATVSSSSLMSCDAPLYDESVHQRRLKCVQLLLQAGAPATTKDGNKQTYLHSAARAGNCRVLQYAIEQFQQDPACKTKRERASSNNHNDDVIWNWRDRWMRTPVHWAVLNGHVPALRVLLLQADALPDPTMPPSNRQSSAAVESPMELCQRLYGDSELGRQMQQLLSDAKDRGGGEVHCK
jgi:acyl-CoA synthetase (AMP-forming)/AMP-acid ligase II/ankyrin repeat protein